MEQISQSRHVVLNDITELSESKGIYNQFSKLSLFCILTFEFYEIEITTYDPFCSLTDTDGNKPITLWIELDGKHLEYECDVKTWEN